jgi:hypothetical protein
MDEIILANHEFAPTKDSPILVFERNVYSWMFFSKIMDSTKSSASDECDDHIYFVNWIVCWEYVDHHQPYLESYQKYKPWKPIEVLNMHTYNNLMHRKEDVYIYVF